MKCQVCRRARDMYNTYTWAVTGAKGEERQFILGCIDCSANRLKSARGQRIAALIDDRAYTIELGRDDDTWLATWGDDRQHSLEMSLQDIDQTFDAVRSIENSQQSRDVYKLWQAFAWVRLKDTPILNFRVSFGPSRRNLFAPSLRKIKVAIEFMSVVQYEKTVRVTQGAVVKFSEAELLEDVAAEVVIDALFGQDEISTRILWLLGLTDLKR